jgi:hypothetical protein
MENPLNRAALKRLEYTCASGICEQMRSYEHPGMQGKWIQNTLRAPMAAEHTLDS